MTKEEQIEELVEYIIEAMDMSALENYAKQQLEEYYNSPEGVEDFNTNYAEMKEIMGDEQMDLIDKELMRYMCWRCRMISNVVKGFSIKNACDDCKNHPDNKGLNYLIILNCPPV